MMKRPSKAPAAGLKILSKAVLKESPNGGAGIYAVVDEHGSPH